MTIFPAAMLLIVIWIWATFRDADRNASLTIAVLPFGMFAAINVGSLSLLIAHVLASATLAFYALRRMGGDVGPICLQTSAFVLAGFVIYSLFSAIILVRVFAGEFLVFPMSVDLDGTQLSIFFASTVKPLAPSSSNIAQSGYILLSGLVFLIFSDITRRRGTNILETGLVLSAMLNILLGALDFAGADTILAFIRTADYSLANEHNVAGLPRVIGGFSEASSFGSFSAVLFSYFAMSYLVGKDTKHGILALGNLAFTVFSYSSTGMAAMGLSMIFITLHGRQFLGHGVPRVFAHWIVIGFALIVIGVCLAAVTTPLITNAQNILNELFFEKRASESGLERSAWARASLQAFIGTWGLGAGVGSLRANGYFASLLGSVGLPGLLFFIVFCWSVFGPVALPAWSTALRISCAARVAALTMLSAKMASGTTPDPEILFMTFAALAGSVKISVRRNISHCKQRNHGRALISGR